MDIYIIFTSIFSIIIGYILGSILPAYIIGRIKGIDIRKVGTKNAGTSNVYHELGLSYAIITGFFDFFKGLLAIWISSQLQENFAIAQLAGYAAVIGHVFPFYINFRGGQGIATSMALLIYYMVNYIFAGTEILGILLYVLLILILFKLSCKVSNFLTILIYPLIGYAVWFYYPGNNFNIFASIILGYITIMAFYDIIKFNQIKIKEEQKHEWWKLVVTPSLLILIIPYAYLPLYYSLILIATLAIILVIIDFIRDSNQNRNENMLMRIQMLFKDTEEKKYLSISIILIAMLLPIISFSFFNRNIVMVALILTLLGDTFSRFFEMAFGNRKLFKKTFEGFIGYIIGVLIFGFILYNILIINPFILLIGGISAAIFETLPLKLTKILLAPLISSFLMVIISILGF